MVIRTCFWQKVGICLKMLRGRLVLYELTLADGTRKKTCLYYHDWVLQSHLQIWQIKQDRPTVSHVLLFLISTE